MGMANDGQISSMSSGYATRGTFTSPVLTATQISKFGKLHLRGTMWEGTKLTVATRSSNVGEESGEGWSPWTAEVPASQWLPITSPVARFFQYRLTFTSSDGAKQTPVVDESERPPTRCPTCRRRIKSIKIAPPVEAVPTGVPTQARRRRGDRCGRQRRQCRFADGEHRGGSD
jgi:hypothetical protein